MIVMFFICVFSFSKVNAVVRDYSLLGKVIYLDAGHQGVGLSQIWRIAIKPSKYKDDLFKIKCNL